MTEMQMQAEIERLRSEMQELNIRLGIEIGRKNEQLKECRRKVLMETAMYLRETDWIEEVWREIMRIAEEETE